MNIYCECYPLDKFSNHERKGGNNGSKSLYLNSVVFIKQAFILFVLFFHLQSVSLPIHLRRFTCTWLYTKMCSKGVELLQRDRQYQEAVIILRRLLGQNEFCVSRRGWWWERLALNLDQHLKKPSEVL